VASLSPGSETTLLYRLRHVGSIAVVGAALVFLVEPSVLASSPLLGTLSEQARDDLYKQLTTVAITLMGFLITAVAILVSLDRGRQIVKELRRGESFSLLILNLLAAVIALFAMTLMTIMGSASLDGIGDACAFLRCLEWLCLVSSAEIVLGGFYFCVVTYKVASHG
jgi:hypothetical protein